MIETAVFRGTKIRAVHINQNAFVDENIFYPIETNSLFDAVLDKMALISLNCSCQRGMRCTVSRGGPH